MAILKNIPRLTHERCRELLDYNPDTGEFKWIKRGRGRKLDGKAGSQHICGYLEIQVEKERHLCHRLAWFYVHGTWAVNIDHINGDKVDNRLINLRPASASQNNANRVKPKHNTSGYKGVHWCASKGCWIATCKARYIGRFDDPAQAHAAYVEAAQRMFGEFHHAGA